MVDPRIIPEGLIPEHILDRVERGESLRTISEEIGFNRRSLCRWLKENDAWQGYLDARMEAAEACDEEAFRVLATAVETKAGISKAREMASHLRWRAKALNKGVYGEHQTIDVKSEISEMTDEQIKARIAALEAKRAAGSGI